MADKQLRAGAATAILTPNLGISLCGAMQDRFAQTIHDELNARCLVLDNGETRLAFVVLDLIAARKEWLSKVKHQVNSYTGIPFSNILISCTHTHTAPTPVNVFQSNAEKKYLEWAGPRVADAVRIAVGRLQPARVGWAVGKEERVVFNRRFFMKPGTKLPSPFPGVEDKVKMNPGVENPNILKPAGPIDPDVAVLAVQRTDGQPLAVFASYSLHYVGTPGTDVSADYFGAVCERVTDLTGGPRRDPKQPFVALLANACFGDINNIDVSKARQAAASVSPDVRRGRHRGGRDPCNVEGDQVSGPGRAGRAGEVAGIRRAQAESRGGRCGEGGPAEGPTRPAEDDAGSLRARNGAAR